ncbi:MAG: NusG domain II-containing protein [Clostridiales bacterium]|nr:NusG domain II-containing protein [Clostridiales bacterium]
MKKADFILIGVIFAAALAALGWIRISRSQGNQVVVYIDGTETARYSLEEDLVTEIESEKGGKNTLTIANGEASVTEANCPDGLCVHQSSISYDGQTIVCLPHRVVVEIQGEEEMDVDGIAR